MNPPFMTEWINRGLIQEQEAAGMDLDGLYHQLKQMASTQRRKAPSSDLNTTALVNETWLKLQKQQKQFRSRQHFFAYCSLAMRHLLVNEAKKNRLLTYMDTPPDLPASLVQESDKLLDLEQVLVQLGEYNPRLEQVFTFKLFGGMEFSEIAEVLEVSERTVFRDWEKARTMLITAMA